MGNRPEGGDEASHDSDNQSTDLHCSYQGLLIKNKSLESEVQCLNKSRIQVSGKRRIIESFVERGK